MSWYFIAYIVISILLIAGAVSLAIWLWRKYAKVVTPEEAVKVLGIDLSLNSGSEEPPKSPPESQAPHRPAEASMYDRMWAFIMSHIGALAVLSAFYMVIWLVAVMYGDNRLNVSIPTIVVALWAGHMLTTFKVIGPREMGVQMLWGWILRDLESGPVSIPWPSHIERGPSTQIKVDFGTIDPKDRAKIESAKSSETWYVMEQPIRITWGDIEFASEEVLPSAMKDRYRNSGLTRTITSDPHLYFMFRISSLRSVIKEAGNVAEVMDRIIDTCVSTLSEFSGQTPAILANSQLPKLNKDLRDRVEELVCDKQGVDRIISRGGTPGKSWGVDILEVRVKDLGFSHDVNIGLVNSANTIAAANAEAIKAVISARATREATEEQSIGEAVKAVNLGEAAAKVQERTSQAALVATMNQAKGEEELLRRKGVGEAAAISAKAEAASKPGGALIIQTEALRDAVKEGNVTLLPADMSGLTSILATAKAIVGNNETPKEKGRE